MSKYVIGLDYGSDSCRAYIVDAATGVEQGTAVKYYPRWMKGLYCQPTANQYRQHPNDYIECLEGAVKKHWPNVILQCRQRDRYVVRHHRSTPVFTDKEGTPLALLPEFAKTPTHVRVVERPHRHQKAAEINELCAKWKLTTPRTKGYLFLRRFWAKVLHVLRADEVFANRLFVVEHCDCCSLISATETENIKRSRCAAVTRLCGWKNGWTAL
jgi:L-ribulokinase